MKSCRIVFGRNMVNFRVSVGRVPVVRTTGPLLRPFGMEIDPSRMENLVYRPAAVEQIDILRRQVAEAIEQLYIAMRSGKTK